MSEKPVLPVPTSPVAAIASIKQQHPHLIACPEFFLSSISPSPSLSIPRQPLVCRPLPPLIPPPPTSAHNRHHGLLRRRQARDQHDPRPGCAYYPSSLNNSSRLHPAPAIPLVLLLCPTINGGGQKKETMVFSASNHGNARGGMKMQSMGCAVAHHSRVTGRCHRTCQLRPPRRANVRNPDELRCRPVPTNALSGAWRLLPTSSGTSS